MSYFHTPPPQAVLNLCTASQNDGLVPGEHIEKAVKMFRRERWYSPVRIAEQAARETPGVPDYPTALSQQNVLEILQRSNATSKPGRDSVWEPPIAGDEIRRSLYAWGDWFVQLGSVGGLWEHDAYGFTPLMHALDVSSYSHRAELAAEGMLENIKLALAANPTPGSEPTAGASGTVGASGAGSGPTRAVILAYVNFKASGQRMPGGTALHVACAHSMKSPGMNQRFVDMLLDCRAEIDAVDNKGEHAFLDRVGGWHHGRGGDAFTARSQQAAHK